MEKVIVARADGKPTGVDIMWVRSRRAFRVESFTGGKSEAVRWIPEARVDEYEEA